MEDNSLIVISTSANFDKKLVKRKLMVKSMDTRSNKLLSTTIYFIITLSGLAALSWEAIWQIKSSIALGISAYGAAVTLIVVMGGMSLGSYLSGKVLRQHQTIRAFKLYGFLEITIGCAGLLLNALFLMLENLDTWIYSLLPESLAATYVVGMIIVLLMPAACMGATLPLMGKIAKKYHLSIAKLYGLNTFGAAVGVLIVALILIPWFGIDRTIYLIAGINIVMGMVLLLLSQLEINLDEINIDEICTSSPIAYKKTIAMLTGGALFILEVAWFRSFAILYPNTSDVFALLLACILVSLFLAAQKASTWEKSNKSLGSQLVYAGILILVMTPIIEHLDTPTILLKQYIASSHHIQSDIHGDSISNANSLYLYIYQMIFRFLLMFAFIFFPVRYLGVALPWLFENDRAPSNISKLYALNTLAAIVGTICATWIMLPTVGFVKTAWVAGVMLIIGGLLSLSMFRRLLLGTLSVAALTIAIYFQTGIGTARFQNFYATDENGKAAKILGFYEGPDVTTSAVAYEDGARALLINSTLAAWESGKTHKRPSAHYMAWMGHLPMILHKNPKSALVICFGTGQTANAVRNEGADKLDIVDVNKTVFNLAHYFKSNQDVLLDPIVKPIVMDGRAYLRRTHQTYDVITLEPMPPHTVGVNSLYSKEFYELAKMRLNRDGMIAQWLPFHSVAPYYAASIVKTFISTFPNAMLWIDKESRTGILVGMNGHDEKIESNWPGLNRRVMRNLKKSEVINQVAFNAIELKEFSLNGSIISDDNQLLAYGKGLYPVNRFDDNLAYFHRIKPGLKLLMPIDSFFE